jgi:hypothetical protein
MLLILMDEQFIPLLEFLLELENLSDERSDNFTKKYGQLRLLVIDEISLVGSRMFAMVDRRMRTIIQTHNDFIGGLDVIVTGDLYKAPPICDRWMYNSQSASLNKLVPNFWKEKVECYELTQVMRKKDLQFSGILNQFQTTMQTISNIAYINRLCNRSPPTDTTFLHLFYTNIKTNEHNKHAFDNTPGKTYRFVAKDIPFETCPPLYKLLDVSSLIGGLHAEICLKQDMLVELCTENHVTNDSLVNGANGLFKDFSTTPESLIWIDFGLPHIGVKTPTCLSMTF